jgi:arylsulfatase A-like enzyme
LTSDHGEAFGESGRYEHDDILEPQVRVPLLLRLPHVPDEAAPTGRIEAPASGVDVAPTLLKLAGLDVPEHVRGMDLLALDLGPGSLRHVLVEDRDKVHASEAHYALYEGRWKLQVRGQGWLARARVALYDLEEDLLGVRDVGNRHPQVRDRLLAEMVALRGGWGGDEEDLSRDSGRFSPGLEGLGYVGGDE